MFSERGTEYFPVACQEAASCLLLRHYSRSLYGSMGLRQCVRQRGLSIRGYRILRAGIDKPVHGKMMIAAHSLGALFWMKEEYLN